VTKFLDGLFRHPLFAPIALYVLLFFPDSVPALFGAAASPEIAAQPYSAADGLFQTVVFYIPALAIVLYFCRIDARRAARRASAPSTPPPSAPGPNPSAEALRFLFRAVFCTAALLLIGSAAVLAENFFLPDAPVEALFARPEGAAEVAVMAVSSIAAAYLEEAFFRVFLLRRLLAHGAGSGTSGFFASLVSAALFAACHAWEGAAGVGSSFLSGLFLNYWIMRTKSLSGAAVSHAAYNIAVYLLPF
jgi:membrane protease YdiL (CAAX protease family)